MGAETSTFRLLETRWLHLVAVQNDSNAGLVYVAGFASLEGQSANDFAIANPAPGLHELRQDQFGFITLTPEGIRKDFAQDLPDAKQTVLAATQSPSWRLNRDKTR